jgi:hypothetical protein
MRRTAWTLIAAASVLLAVPAQAAESGALAVAAHEFSLTLSRATVPAGDVRVQLQNRGEDEHDLLVTRLANGRRWRLPVAEPGAVSTRTLPLRPGRYRLICTLEGHEALGMRAALRATRTG